MSKINILVVDDEEIIRSLFIDILQDKGYNVTAVRNGKEASDKINDTFFHLAFLDVHMPIMNGVQTLRFIKKVSPETTIVMMDSFPDILLEEAIEEGAVNCIHKPFDIKEMLKAIEEALDNKQRVKEHK